MLDNEQHDAPLTMSSYSSMAFINDTRLTKEELNELHAKRALASLLVLEVESGQANTQLADAVAKARIGQCQRLPGHRQRSHHL